MAAIHDHASAHACAAHREFGLPEYMAYVLAQSRLSKSVFVYSLIYAGKFVHLRQQAPHGSSRCRAAADMIPECEHCMFLGTLMIAFKFTHDNCYKLKYWRDWARMEISEIVQLELATLQALDYNLVVEQSSFDRCAQAYSDQCGKPGNTSLYAAVVLYLYTVRQLREVLAVQAPPTPCASPEPFDQRCGTGSRRGSVDSAIFPDSGALTPEPTFTCRPESPPAEDDGLAVDSTPPYTPQHNLSGGSSDQLLDLYHRAAPTAIAPRPYYHEQQQQQASMYSSSAPHFEQQQYYRAQPSYAHSRHAPYTRPHVAPVPIRPAPCAAAQMASAYPVPIAYYPIDTIRAPPAYNCQA